MKANPYYNALLALVYIVGVVSLLFLAPKAIGGDQTSILFPMGVLALLVLSVCLMAFLFFYEPITLLLDGHREKAVSFFLRTVGTFAAGTAVILAIAAFVNGGLIK